MIELNVMRCVDCGSLISLLRRTGERFGTGRHWVGTNTGQIDVYTLAMRGLAGFEAILTREFHRIPRMATPQDNHPRGDISE
jgi:hypothetical protein